MQLLPDSQGRAGLSRPHCPVHRNLTSCSAAGSFDELIGAPPADGDNERGKTAFSRKITTIVATQLSERLALNELGWVHEPEIPATAAACVIWFMHISQAGRFPLSLLSTDEQERYDRYRFDIDRHRFLAGCAMARLFLCDRLGLDASAIVIDRTCPRCGADHGKPRLTGSAWQYSISHSGDYVAVAFSDAAEVGLDVELDGVHRSRDVWQAVLSPAELRSLEATEEATRDHAFLRYWTRKEAALKASGRGLTVEPWQLKVSGPEDAAMVTRWPAELATIPVPSLCDLDFLPGHVATLAVLGPLGGVRAFEVIPRSRTDVERET